MSAPVQHPCLVLTLALGVEKRERSGRENEPGSGLERGRGWTVFARKYADDQDGCSDRSECLRCAQGGAPARNPPYSTSRYSR